MHRYGWYMGRRRYAVFSVFYGCADLPFVRYIDKQSQGNPYTVFSVVLVIMRISSTCHLFMVREKHEEIQRNTVAHTHTQYDTLC